MLIIQVSQPVVSLLNLSDDGANPGWYPLRCRALASEGALLTGVLGPGVWSRPAGLTVSSRLLHSSEPSPHSRTGSHRVLVSGTGQCLGNFCIMLHG